LLNEEEPAGRLKGNHTPDTQRKLLGKNAMKGSTLMAQTTSPAVTYTNTPLGDVTCQLAFPQNLKISTAPPR
jgi:hypothetical protein